MHDRLSSDSHSSIIVSSNSHTLCTIVTLCPRRSSLDWPKMRSLTSVLIYLMVLTWFSYKSWIQSQNHQQLNCLFVTHRWILLGVNVPQVKKLKENKRMSHLLVFVISILRSIYSSILSWFHCPKWARKILNFQSFCPVLEMSIEEHSIKPAINLRSSSSAYTSPEPVCCNDAALAETTFD